jgi:diacylglycerol kinase
MDLESRDKRKKLGAHRFFRSFKYSFDGLAYAIKDEQSILVMIVITFIALLLGIILKISVLEWILVFISIGLVLGTELLNTSIEASMDLVSPKYNELAKVAKDTASASVFIYSLIAFIIGSLVFVPKIIDFLERM